MTTDKDVTPLITRGASRLLVPVFIAIELFAGLIQGWIIPLLGEIASFHEVPGGAVSWIFMVGMLSSAMSVPFLSMLADRYGKRLLLVIAVALTAIGSALIALAPNFPLLLVGAAIQGPIAALLPIEMGILKQLRPKSAQRIVSYLVGTLTLGIALGSLSSGFLMEATGNLAVTQMLPAVPLFILTALIFICVPQMLGDRSSKVDWLGALLLSVSLGALMYGLSAASEQGWLSPVPVITVLGGALGLALFLVVESRAEAPLLDVAVLRRVKLGLPMVLGMLIALTAFGISTPTTLYLTANPADLGYGVGLGAASAGAIVAIVFLLSSLGAFIAPVFVRFLGNTVALAAACAVSGASLLVLLTGPASPVFVTVILSVNSLTAWIALSILPGIIVDRAPINVATTLSGLYNCGRSLGGSIAGALVASVMAALVLTGNDAAPAGTPSFASFQVIWSIFAVILFLSAVLALFLRRAPQVEAAPVSEAPVSVSIS